MRITGLATGLDMDEIVKSSMKPYRIKIDKKGQDKEILEIKQKLYREVIKDSRELYNKYFDVTKSDSLLLSKNWSSVKFESSDKNVLTVTGSGDAKAENYTITGNIAKAATAVLKLSEVKDNKVVVNGTEFILKGDNEKEKANDLFNQLKTSGINVSVRYSEFAGDSTANAEGFIFESTLLGKDNTFNVELIDGKLAPTTPGEDGRIVFTDSKGGVHTYEGISNTITLDGVSFKFTGEIPIGGITINGKQDVTEIKDKLVKFINDYNTLTEKLNKLTTEKRNRNFSPLTADQKKEMSEDEIKLWNEKVEKGQLSRDTDLSRISNSLKQAMRTFVDGTGLNLEKIGISPVADYQGTKNGTFVIDETKLTKALEENIQEVMDMFIKSAPKDETLSESKKYSKIGIMNRIKDALYKETITVTSSLLKKAGYEGSSTAYNNEIRKSIERYEQKMADMEKDFTRREQALYTKYANLETIMNKYNSQQSYLSQQLGLG
ncbi:flagellar filament capping protein FliD [Clostridium sp. HCS.1]|uniref:flagellar filament capping protein FliD n=1 Tax=Clostridium sp. HCS.1 TaxID=3238594 RepID=UPI003A0FE78C